MRNQLTTITLPALLALVFVPQAGAGTVASSPAAQPEISRATSEIVIDGKLNEAAWQQALTLDLPYNTRPGENTPAPVRTEAFLAYNDQFLYVAFKAYDPHPENIRAHYTRRDEAFDDDFIGIVVDTFNDERRAYEFFANPLGVQMDLLLNDVSGGESANFDAIWYAQGRLTDFGYVVEMAIPMGALRFPAGGGEMIWNIDLVRFWPREHRYRLALHPLDRGRNCYLCQGVKVSGLAGLKSSSNLLVVPTVTASRTDARTSYDAPMVAGDTNTEAGVTMEWGVTPNITLAGTINPDFSQIEADVAQLNVNKRFALFYPERRPFFLEGEDYFQTLTDILYTRNIANPDWGTKATGKIAGHSFGFLATDDQITNIIFPSSQDSEFGSFNFESRAQAARYRYDVSDGYTVGGIVTNRSGEGYSNTVTGVDGILRFTENDTLAFQALQSQTQYNQQMQTQFGVSGETLRDQLYVLAYEHGTRNYFVEGEYIQVGDDFRADLGFIPRVGYSETSIGSGYTWYGEEENWYSKYGVRGEWGITHATDGLLLERETEVEFYLDGGLQSHFSVGVTQQDELYNGVLFAQTNTFVFGSITPSGAFQTDLYIEVGDGIDFTHTRPGEFVHVQPDISLNLGRHLNTEINYTYEHLDVAGGRLYTAKLSELRLAWYFNLQSYLRVIAQYQDLERNSALYAAPVEQHSRDLAAQVLFSWSLNPRTVMYLGYSSGYIGNVQRHLQQQQRTFFLKLSYAWQL